MAPELNPEGPPKEEGIQLIEYHLPQFVAYDSQAMKLAILRQSH